MNSKLFLFFLCIVTTTAFADNLILDNETSYPLKNQKSRIAIQWANSAKEVDDGNNAMLHGTNLKSESLQIITQTGKNILYIPKKAEYFRVLVWSTGEGNPDFLTNWVDIVPSKTYTLQTDHLVPAALMSGTGC